MNFCHKYHYLVVTFNLAVYLQQMLQLTLSSIVFNLTVFTAVTACGVSYVHMYVKDVAYH